MKISDCIHCTDFPCTDMNHAAYVLPEVEIDPQSVSIMLVSEAAPVNAADYYYAQAGSLFRQTTLQAFQDAGAHVASFEDILALGVYLTTAVKCGKIGYAIQRSSVVECSHLLEQELDLFPNVKAYLLMGDVAIQAVNQIARRTGQPRPIPAGSTYKMRGGEFTFRGARAFPSYLQAGPSFFIEKSKRRMIAEDIAAALAVAARVD